MDDIDFWEKVWGLLYEHPCHDPRHRPNGAYPCVGRFEKSLNSWLQNKRGPNREPLSQGRNNDGPPTCEWHRDLTPKSDD